MSSISNLLSAEFITENSLPSNVNYGSAIFRRGGVQFITQESEFVEAWSGGLDGTIREGSGSRRRVKFSVIDGQLSWICTGNPKNHQIFCKHCVAVALAILE
jgi:uncharacterized Zn finger protein